MLDSFLIALSAVTPFLIYLGLGFFAVRSKLATASFMQSLNKFTFQVLFPFMTFNSVYGAAPEDMPSLKLIVFSVGSVLLLILLLMAVVPKIVKENPRRGVIIQAIFRSNFVIYGLPLAASVFGAKSSSVTGVMVLIMVSLFNISSVIVLEIFREGGQVKLKPLLLGILKNPLLQGCVVGLIFFALRIRLPELISKPIATLANMASTLALITLGAALRFDEMAKNRRVISIVLVIRLILLPLVGLTIGWLIGLRGIELFLVLLIYGTPIATSSYPMAQNMGGDGPLAGQLVFVSTVFSLGTIFLFIFGMSQLGLL